MKQFYAKHKFDIWAFFVPFLCALAVCVGNRVFPFGNNSLLHMDLYHQYCPFLEEFANKLKHGESLFYTWNLGLGSDYVSLYAYYLASPFNWLLLLVPRGAVIEFIEFFILLRLGLCGLFASKYLSYHFKADKSLSTVLFGTAYALCGFVAAYSWDIMWLDTIALAPLVLVGLEKLVKENKIALYTITLAIAIWSNYYISIMLCIFLVFYFAWLFIFEAKGGKQKLWATLRFAICSLISGAFSAVLILPEMTVLAYSGSSVGSGFPKKMEWYFNILAQVSRLHATAKTYEGLQHWPNLYCGVFVVLLAVLFAFNRKISLKEKLPAYMMVGFFFVSFANNYLDFIWHGFHFPQQLPGRQSYLFALLLITMAFHAWKERMEYRQWHIFVAFGVTFALFVVGWIATDSEVTSKGSFFVTLLFLVLYLVVFLLTKTQTRQLVIFGVCLAELVLNFYVTGFATSDRSSYTKKDKNYAILLEAARADSEKNEFYRVEAVERQSKNDSSYHTYSSASVFSSLMNLDVSHLYQSLYMEGGKNYYCFNGATPLTNVLFDMKYIISDSALSTGDYRTLVATSGDYYLYRNNEEVSLGYVLKDEVVENWENPYSTGQEKIHNLNELAHLLGAEEDYISYAYVNKEEMPGLSKYEITEDGYYYASFVKNANETLRMSTSEGFDRKFLKASHRYLLELGELKANETVSLINDHGEEIEYNLYQINRDAYLDAYQTLTRYPFEVEMFSSTSVVGNICNYDPGKLVLSIPYVPGWKAYVDGEEVEIECFSDALIMLSLGSGEHDISLKYHTPNLAVGAGISAFSILAFLLLLGVRRIRHAKEIKRCNSVL